MKIFKRIVIAALLIICICFFLTVIFPEKFYNISMQMQRNSAGLMQKEITSGDDKIFYLESGAGLETIVLIHGFGADKDNWPQMVKFMPGYHFIIPDLPGFGESTKSNSARYDVSSQVERLDKFLAKLGCNKFYIGGNSMGGNISGIYAAKYPQKIKGLILLNNSGINAPVKSVVFKKIETGSNPLLINSRDDFKQLLHYLFVKEPFIPFQIKGVLADRAVENKKFNEKVFKDFISSPAMLEDHFKALTMPVLIIWGDKDQILDVSSVSVLERGIKNHTTRILKDCGHVPMMERPGETAGYIKSFIELNK